MPTTKKESLIFGAMMCFIMVMVMTFYNLSLARGISRETLRLAIIGFPLGFLVAFSLEWFLVSPFAKWFSNTYLLKGDEKMLKKILILSTCIVIPMVFFMSLYGAMMSVVQTQAWNQLFQLWMKNIPLNFLLARPLQIFVAGPIVRKSFQMLFAEA